MSLAKHYYGNCRRRKNRNINRRPFFQKGRRLLWFYLMLCMALIFSIVYMQWRMGNLADLTNKWGQFLTGEDRNQQNQVQEIPKSMEALSAVRVVLLEDDKNIYRENVTVAGDAGCVVSDGTKQWTTGAGEGIFFTKEMLLNFVGTTTITPAEGGQLYVTDAKGNRREAGYRGKIEVWQDKNGYALVNEVPTDVYLAGVLPSEMPESYGAEALKAQAVCARSYLYTQARKEHYPQFHAHLDDTVSFQVYNHQKYGDLSVQAVRETDSLVLTSRGQLVDALYYSTSCGYSQSGSIFDSSSPVLQSVYIGNGEKNLDFETYIKGWDENAYEKDERYFRWVAVADPVKRKDQMIDTIEKLQKKDEKDIVYSDELKKRIKDKGIRTAAEAFGELKEFQVIQRNSGGAIEKASFVFEQGKVQVSGELHIRDILGAALTSVQLQNGEIVTGISRLYSAAFVSEQKDGLWILYGGGCGHGAGMSQNGAKMLAAAGYGYEEILKFFYQGAEITRLPQQ